MINSCFVLFKISRFFHLLLNTDNLFVKKIICLINQLPDTHVATGKGGATNGQCVFFSNIHAYQLLHGIYKRRINNHCSFTIQIWNLKSDEDNYFKMAVEIRLVFYTTASQQT